MGTVPVRRFFVYMVICSDGTVYTGYTTDLQKRLATHNSGRGSKYTKSRLPVVLAYSEEASDLGAALRRESQIKKLSRSSKLLLCSSYSAKPHSIR